MIIRSTNPKNRRGIGGVMNYYEMPDAATQAILAARGDTIQIIAQPTYNEMYGEYLPPPPAPIAPTLAPATPLDFATIAANQAKAIAYEEQLIAWHKAQNAANDRASYDAYMKNVGASISQTSNTQVQAQSSTTVTSVSLQNLTSGNNARFNIGDSWLVSAVGPVGASVSVRGGKNGASDNTIMGIIGSDGKWSKSGVMGEAEVGSWNEAWSVGGSLKATYSFDVVKSQTSVPSTIKNTQDVITTQIDNFLGADNFLTKNTLGLPNWSLLGGAAILLFVGMKGRE